MRTKNLSIEETVAWLRFARDSRFSTLQKHRLLAQLVSPIEINRASYRDLCGYAEICASAGRPSKSHQGTQANIDKDLLWLARSDCYLINLNDDRYPVLLREISDPPICLFARGDLSLLAEPKIAIVGSRRPTPAGVKITQKIAADLAKLGIVVTSGMALGIDAVAHRAALYQNEPTIAVMGSGLDIIAPARHRTLFEQIACNGLLLSEYPLGYPASKYTFPQRNRIVSGLAHGVVIVEAARKSGTLITARLAMEQNREVFVIPGSPVNPQYLGSHHLIRQGATLVSEAQDVLLEMSCHLNIVLDELADIDTDSDQKMSHRISQFPLLKYINFEPTRVDEIILNSGLTASEVSSMLLILEVEGLVTTSDGRYSRLS